MSILTRICVVVLLVLILLAVPVFVTQAVVPPNFRYAFEQERKNVDLYAMEAKREKLAHAKTIRDRDAAQEKLARLTSEMQGENDSLKAELAAWRARASEQQNDQKRMATELASLNTEIKAANERADIMAQQLNAARAEMDGLNQDLLRVNNLYKQTEAESERLKKMAQVRYERIRELEEENELLQSGGAIASSAGEKMVPVASQKITGTISAIKGDYASINLGSAKGIQPGMRLIVYRGADLVGFLRVDEVDISQAAGIIVERRLDPMQGDKVTTSLQ